MRLTLANVRGMMDPRERAPAAAGGMAPALAKPKRPVALEIGDVVGLSQLATVFDGVGQHVGVGLPEILDAHAGQG